MLEVRPAVKRNKRVTIKSKGDGHNGAGGLAVGFLATSDVVLDMIDGGIGEDGGIMLGSIFTFRIKPKAGCDLVERHVVGFLKG